MSFLLHIKLLSAQISQQHKGLFHSSWVSPVLPNMLSQAAVKPLELACPSLWSLTAPRTAWVQLWLPGWVLGGGGSKSACFLLFTFLMLIIISWPHQLLGKLYALLFMCSFCKEFLTAERSRRASGKKREGNRSSVEPLRECSCTTSHPNHTQLAWQLGSSPTRACITSPGHPRFTCLFTWTYHFGVSPSLKRAPAGFKAVLLFVKTYSCFVHKAKPNLKITLLFSQIMFTLGWWKWASMWLCVCVYATHTDIESFIVFCKHICKWSIKKKFLLINMDQGTECFPCEISVLLLIWETCIVSSCQSKIYLRFTRLKNYILVLHDQGHLPNSNQLVQMPRGTFIFWWIKSQCLKIAGPIAGSSSGNQPFTFSPSPLLAQASSKTHALCTLHSSSALETYLVNVFIKDDV